MVMAESLRSVVCMFLYADRKGGREFANCIYARR